MNIETQDFYTQAILSMSALVGLMSFLMLGQGRLPRLIFVFAMQGFLLTLTAILAANELHSPHLYISALLTFALKVVFIPVMLQKQVFAMNIHRDVEALKNNTAVMLSGASLMIFSYYVLQPLFTRPR